jgi:hypothetical protein
MRPCSVRLLSLLAAGALGAAGCFPRPQNPLCVAAAHGDVGAIERLIAEGVDPNLGAASRAFTPVTWAAREGQVAAIRVLAAHGADLDAPAGVNDWVPLHHALHKQQTAAALVLIELGADISGRIGQRALHMAAGYGNPAVTQALLDRGVDPRVDIGNGPSLLGLAAGGGYDIDYRWSGCEKHTETVRVLVKHAPDLQLLNNAWDRAARAYVRHRGCHEMLAMLR